MIAKTAFFRYFMYLIVYSILGFILERIINLIFLGEYYDNSVLFGPWQPLYGSGIAIAILIISSLGLLNNFSKAYKPILALMICILSTYFVEAVTGYGFEVAFGVQLWDYNEFFNPELGTEYINLIASTLFGFLSFIAIIFIHPFIKKFVKWCHPVIVYQLCILFLLDVVITLYGLV